MNTRYHLTACEVIPDPFPFTPAMPTQVPVRHYRVIDQQGRFQGGEWCDPVAAQIWASRQVQGASQIVECDKYGNRLDICASCGSSLTQTGACSVPCGQ